MVSCSLEMGLGRPGNALRSDVRWIPRWLLCIQGWMPCMMGGRLGLQSSCLSGSSETEKGPKQGPTSLLFCPILCT